MFVNEGKKVYSTVNGGFFINKLFRFFRIRSDFTGRHVKMNNGTSGKKRFSHSCISKLNFQLCRAKGNSVVCLGLILLLGGSHN